MSQFSRAEPSGPARIFVKRLGPNGPKEVEDRTVTGADAVRKVSFEPAHVEEGDVAVLTTESDTRLDYVLERDGERFAGTHLIIDLIGAHRLDDLALVEDMLYRCVEAAGATLLHIHLHHFTPNGGVSGVAVLSESHISIHSWPEAQYAALDIFMCGHADPFKAVPVLEEVFTPERITVQEHRRGSGML